MLGKTHSIDIKDQFINQLTCRLLTKYYNYTDEFWISEGCKQVVHGINYKLHVDLHSLNKRIILRFVHKAWEENDKEFTFIPENEQRIYFNS
jgi:hypothetical protein